MIILNFCDNLQEENPHKYYMTGKEKSIILHREENLMILNLQYIIYNQELLIVINTNQNLVFIKGEYPYSKIYFCRCNLIYKL